MRPLVVSSTYLVGSGCLSCRFVSARARRSRCLSSKSAIERIAVSSFDPKVLCHLVSDAEKIRARLVQGPISTRDRLDLPVRKRACWSVRFPEGLTIDLVKRLPKRQDSPPLPNEVVAPVLAELNAYSPKIRGCLWLLVLPQIGRAETPTCRDRGRCKVVPNYIFGLIGRATYLVGRTNLAQEG
jgi:hypothetical protein